VPYNLLFVISHQPNPRFIKQINYFSRHGFNVSVVYFERSYLANLNSNIDESVKLYLLGAIENGQYFQRVWVYIKSIFKLKKILYKIQPDKVIITNVDILLLLILNNIKQYANDIIVEISDLRGYTFNNKITDKIQQYIDSILFKRYVSKLILTSPKFYEFYYQYKFFGKYFILENKILKAMLPKKLSKVKNKIFTIGIVGLLLDGKPHKTLFEYVKDKADIELHIYGIGAYQNQAMEYAQKYDNIKYFGGYDFFQDISSIYASLDVIYMSYDTTRGDFNINLALPNKLYEAMYFKVPIITSEDTYLGELVEQYNIGACIKCCDKGSLSNVLSNRNFNDFVENFDDIEEGKFIADGDYKKLEQYISE
jgi:succinoglycan biosynthesis protein ExoL